MANPMNRFDHFGRALRLLRERRGLSQVELSRRSGISSAMLSTYESGRGQPNLTTFFRLAEALDLDLGELGTALDLAAGRPPAGGRRGAGRTLLEPDAAGWEAGYALDERIAEGGLEGLADLFRRGEGDGGAD